MSAIRTVKTLHDCIKVLEGAGFPVRRPFPTKSVSNFDPFLLLDHMDADWKPFEAVGAPDHPHRGFETVTYVIKGHMQHKDSQGHSGELKDGDVQWMTAGSGVVHSEEPHPDFLRSGGRMSGFQLWVNLPKRDKMIKPRYQELPSSGIPVAQSPDGLTSVKVVAGEALGVKAAIDTRTPIIYLHYTMRPGATTVANIPSNYRAMAYVFEGNVMSGPSSEARIATNQAAFFGDGDAVQLHNPASAATNAQLLLIAGVPLNEPVVQYGPFVMNTREEIQQAFEDYRAGRLGSITH